MFARFFLFFCLLGLSVNAFAQDHRPQPEMSTGISHELQIGVSKKDMVVTAHPEATKAARKILDQGGNAIDALVAAQLVLGLVEPQSSGLGGGAFLLYHDGRTGKTHSFDGRETAPMAVNQEMYRNEDGSVMGFYEIAHSGLSVGVPGIPKLLDDVHDVFGKQDWSVLFHDAIDLADNGFVVTPRLETMARAEAQRFKPFPIASKYFGQVVAGERLKNPDYAESLRGYRNQGSSYFYNSDFTQEIVDSVKRYGGTLSADDFSSYTVKKRDTLCDVYRGRVVCSMNEPSSGGLTILMVLKIIEHFDLSDGPTAENIHKIAEASRSAFIARNMHMADSDFDLTLNRQLLDGDYINAIAQSIGQEAREKVYFAPVDQWEEGGSVRPVMFEEFGTSHISIVDQWGNIASMTTTVESAFGSHIMVGGLLLNNQLTDFTFTPLEFSAYRINLIEGGKRPRSSMAPTIVFNEDGSPLLVIGSAGGSRIIGYILKSIIAVLDWKQTIEHSVASHHLLSRGEGVELEVDHSYPSRELEEMNHKIVERDLNSGITAIYIKDGVYTGVADPRREGTAR